MTLHPLFRVVMTASCLGLVFSVLPLAPDFALGLRSSTAFAQTVDPDSPAAEDPEAEAGEEPEEMPDLEPGDLPDEADIAPIVFDDDAGDYDEWLAQQSQRNDPALLITRRGDAPKVTWDGVLTMVLDETQVEFRDHVSGRTSHTVGLTTDEAKAFFDRLSSLDPETARTKAGFSG
jgi:hypothetical protein